MKRKELRIEINEITRIFLSAKYYELDFNYFHSIKFNFPSVLNAYYFLFNRIFHSISVALILDLCKLFDSREKFSLNKLRNKMLENYSKSELNESFSKTDFENLFKTIDSKEIEQILKKLKTTRDEYYAHFDRSRTDFNKITINSKETGKLIQIAEYILKTIELKFFNVSVDYKMTTGELGHNIFQRLDEWERYRNKYGLL
ncbi:MAG: hypothetical protein JXA16_13190 [Bacteroidales bacterium]|nr:hypothetical protein [Bacteroidales bacterium]